jgi:polar amino acid transport system substrate-binding protein
MKKSFYFISMLFVVAIVLFTQCQKDNDKGYHYQFRFITEELKPYNFNENGKLTGLGVELLEEICDALDIPFQVQVLPWEEGYSIVQNTDNAVLFSMVLNAERRDLFKWAGPFTSVEFSFYSAAQNQLTLNSLEDARQVGAIGVLRDYSIEQFLVKNGFTNLVYCADPQDALTKLLNGDIDLYPSDRYSVDAAIHAMGQNIYLLRDLLPIRTEMVYFAFNKMVPDDVIADIQQEIDRAKENGFLSALHKKYLSTASHPGTLQIYTEDYPPLTFMNKYGEITGFASEVVYEIMKRNQIFVDIKLSAWSNGYELALNNPNFCLFTMERTEIRENLFQWVGPIGTNSTYFYTKAGSGITITSIEDAMNIGSVGTVNSWYSDQYLREMGFTNLVSDDDPAVMTLKLMQGEVDAFVCSAVVFPDLLKDQGYQYSEVVESFELMSSDTYISFSKNTAAATVSQWQSTVEAMKADGTFEAIRSRWFP